MSAWFRRLGEPLGVEEHSQVSRYLAGLGLAGDLPVRSVSDWQSAHAAIADPAWDRRWWDAEQREQDRLTRKATQGMGEVDLWRSLTASLEPADAVYDAAAAEAARGGCSDVSLVRAAAGALSQALYLADLTRLAGERATHAFAMKKALFAGGHWPLGIVQGTYYVF